MAAPKMRKRRTSMFDPIGYCFTFMCVGERDDRYIKELYLDLADELLPYINVPFVVTNSYSLPEENKSGGRHFMVTPEAMAGASGRDAILSPFEDHILPEYPDTDFYGWRINRSDVCIRFSEMPTLPMEYEWNGYDYAEEVAFYRDSYRHKHLNRPESELRRLVHKCLLCPDPSLKCVAVPTSLCTSNPRIFPGSHLLEVESISVEEEMIRRWKALPSESEREMIEGGRFIHRVQACLPRIFMKDGKMPKAVLDSWKQKLEAGSDRYPASQGTIRMDAMLMGSSIIETPRVWFRMRMPGEFMSNLPGATWGMSLSPAQAQIVDAHGLLAAGHPFSEVRRYVNGGLYLQLTDSADDFPADALMAAHRLLKPYYADTNKKHFNAPHRMLVTCRLPFEEADIEIPEDEAHAFVLGLLIC